VQELVFQAMSDQVEEVDFSHFWDGVESRIAQQDSPSLRLRLRLWIERWKLAWPSSAPAWATVAVVLSVSAFLLSRPPSSDITSVSQEAPPSVLAARENDQAQIESLSSTETVFLWNESASNATVIWVSDDNDGGMP